VRKLLKSNWPWPIGGKNSAWPMMQQEKISFSWQSLKNHQRPQQTRSKVAELPEEESPHPNLLVLIIRVMRPRIIELQVLMRQIEKDSTIVTQENG